MLPLKLRAWDEKKKRRIRFAGPASQAGLNRLRNHALFRKLLVWRNDTRSETHYYAPFPGQVSVPDFMKFYEDPYTLFENDLKNIYRKKKRYR